MPNFLVRLSAIMGMGLGAMVAIVSGAWGVMHMAHLTEANILVQRKARQSSAPRADYLHSRKPGNDPPY